MLLSCYGWGKESSRLLEAYSITRVLEELEFLVSRWSVESQRFITAWGEFGPTLEDVLNVMALPLYRNMNAMGATFEKEQVIIVDCFYWPFQGHTFQQVHVCIMDKLLDKGEGSRSLLVLEALRAY